MQFGLMLFGSSQDSFSGDKYQLAIACARFADRHNFSSIWTPERHFTEFGGIYPNPAVINAALARETQRLRLQSGSLVLPLHHPIRIAEDWSIVDNLSGGRVGISFASGWNPDDFAMFPEKYQDRHRELFAGVETVRKLWRGESIQVKSGNGNLVEINIYPTPIQPELPIWITAASNPQTFTKAGKIGANILTSLLGQQSLEELTKKIILYRQARAESGYDPDTGIVSIMLHTFVGEDLNQVKELIRVPYCEYIKSNFQLFAQGVPQSKGYSPEQVKMSEKDIDEFVDFLFEGFASSKGLIGTPETCLNLIEKLDAIGVDEIACLLDIGQSKELILEHLPYLDHLREIYSATVIEDCRRKQLAGDIEPQFIESQQIPNRAVKNPLPTLTNAANDITSKIKQPANNKIQQTSQIENSLKEIQNRCQNQKFAREFYADLEKWGMQLGETYQGVETLWLGQGEALAKIKLASEKVSHNSIKIHPALLDSCHQIMGAVLMYVNNQSFYLPVGIRSIQVHKPISNEVWSYAVVTTPVELEKDGVEGNVFIFNTEGNLLIEVTGLQMHKADKLLSEDLEKKSLSKDSETSASTLLLDEVQQQSSADKDSEARAYFREKIESASESERYEILIAFLQAEVAQVLGYLGSSQLPSPEQGFFDIGMDSLMAVALRNRLQDTLGCSLPTVFVLEYSSVVDLAEYIAEEILHLKKSQPEKLKCNQIQKEDDIEAEISAHVKQLSEQDLANIINQQLDELMEEN